MIANFIVKILWSISAGKNRYWTWGHFAVCVMRGFFALGRPTTYRWSSISGNVGPLCTRWFVCVPPLLGHKVLHRGPDTALIWSSMLSQLHSFTNLGRYHLSLPSCHHPNGQCYSTSCYDRHALRERFQQLTPPICCCGIYVLCLDTSINVVFANKKAPA